jgi:hypothetical protein
MANELIDHYKLWRKDSQEIGIGVELQGQFNENPFPAAVESFDYIGNPVSKNEGPILKEHHHLTAYRLHPTIERPPRYVHFTNQLHGDTVMRWECADPFGEHPPLLLVPACKSLETVPPQGPPGGDHYICYPVIGDVVFSARATKPQRVVLLDQFDKILGKAEVIKKLQPAYFGVPVTKKRKKTFHPIEDAVSHLAIYRFFESTTFKPAVHTRDQFAPWTFQGCVAEMLAVPSLKRFPDQEA